MPSAGDALEIVNGRVCLVDGTITPCWSWQDHKQLWSRKHGTTGFNAQLVCLLNGDAIYISDPLPGKTHDAAAFRDTPVAEDRAELRRRDRGQGLPGLRHGDPTENPARRCTQQRRQGKQRHHIGTAGASEQFVAHFKSWRIFHTDYRRPHETYREAYDATRGLYFFSVSWGFE